MAETVNKGDFVEIDYSGYLADSKELFDTTIKEVADKNGIKDDKFSSVVVCIGSGSILMGLENALIGKEIGANCTINLTPEQAFGKKDGKLMKIMNANIFRKEQIEPVVGLQVDIDGMTGTIRSVTGGRTTVDFNHPLAGKALYYDVHIKKRITDTVEKTKALFCGILKADKGHVDCEVAEGKATIHSHFELPNELAAELKKEMLKHIPELKDIIFLKISDENHKHHHHQ